MGKKSYNNFSISRERFVKSDKCHQVSVGNVKTLGVLHDAFFY